MFLNPIAKASAVNRVGKSLEVMTIETFAAIQRPVIGYSIKIIGSPIWGRYGRSSTRSSNNLSPSHTASNQGCTVLYSMTLGFSLMTVIASSTGCGWGVGQD